MSGGISLACGFTFEAFVTMAPGSAYIRPYACQARVKARRKPTSSAAIVDSQSVKRIPKKGTRGYDGGKKVKGGTRHMLVDALGLILHVLVHAAYIQDYRGGKLLVAPLKGTFPRLELMWADSGSRMKTSVIG